MRNRINFAALFLFAAACATSPSIPQNRYGLEVVPDYRTYERLAAAAPDKRLVDIESIDPSIRLDIRYATPNNFMHTTLYPVARAFLRAPAAAALHAVQQDLAREGLGLKVFDGYRPYRITERMW